jgi:hypothetical protein
MSLQQELEFGGERPRKARISGIKIDQTSSYQPITSSPGELAWVPIDELTIDKEYYQRDQMDTAHCEKIAREWDWRAAESLTVFRRVFEDDRLVVAEGGGRLDAARKRGDIRKLPCNIHDTKSMAEEAEIFAKINNGRKRLRTPETHKAELTADNPNAIDVDDYITALNAASVTSNCLAEMRRTRNSKGKFKWDAAVKLLPLFLDCKGQHISKRLFQASVLIEEAFIKEGINESLTNGKLRKKFLEKGLANIENAFDGLPLGRRQCQGVYVQSLARQLKMNPSQKSVLRSSGLEVE